MPGALLISSSILFDKLANLKFYPFVYSTDPCTGNVFPTKACLLFKVFSHLGKLGLLITGGVLPTFHILLYIYCKPNYSSGLFLFANSFILAVTCTVVVTWPTTIPNSSLLAHYTNQIAQFEVILTNSKISLEKTHSAVSFLKRHCKLLQQEIKKYLKRDKTVDIVGIYHALNLSNIWVATLIATPLALYLGVDPIEPLLQYSQHMINTRVYYALNIFRWIICILSTFENCRNNVYFSAWGLFAVTSFPRYLQKVCKLPLQVSIKRYTQLRLLHRYSDWFMPNWMAVTLGVVFVTGVILNCFTAVGWRVVPLKYYLPMIQNGILIQVFMAKVIFTTVSMHEQTSYLIRYDWPQKLVNRLSTQEIVSRKLLLKVIKTQQPITYKSRNTATLDRDTQNSYYLYTVNYTVNLLLILKKSINKGRQFDIP